MIDNRGSTALVQYLAYSGSSHRRKGAARHKFDMFSLYRSPISMGRRGIIYTFKRFLPAIAALRRRGGGGQHPVGLRQF
jgi:hypothetical protein